MARTTAVKDNDRERLPALDEANQILVAHELIILGARIAVVSYLTNMAPKKLRRLYKEWTNKDPVPGPLPSNPSYYTEDLMKSLHASIFLNLYRYYASLKYSDTDVPKLLIQSYRAYLDHFESKHDTSELDINRAWAIIRAYRSGQLLAQRCKRCHSNYVVTTSFSRQGCPICAIHNNSKCIDCSKPIRDGKDLLQTKGKKRCACCTKAARNRRISMQRLNGMTEQMVA